jgi:hypothetical protein
MGTGSAIILETPSPFHKETNECTLACPCRADKRHEPWINFPNRRIFGSVFRYKLREPRILFKFDVFVVSVCMVHGEPERSHVFDVMSRALHSRIRSENQTRTYADSREDWLGRVLGYPQVYGEWELCWNVVVGTRRRFVQYLDSSSD